MPTGNNKQAVYGLSRNESQGDRPGEDSEHRLRQIPFPDISEVARYLPLIAAILAPLSTLLNIPAMTERWYFLNGVSQPDPPASLALSITGLGLNVLANALLLFRFSTVSRRWTSLATRLSLLSWLGTTTVGIINLIIFGALTRNSQGHQYSEGFWSAVVSLADAGVISIALLIHYFGAFGDEDYANTEEVEIRMQGRQFMLSFTAFIIIIGFQALAFSQLEGWNYLNSIYFSIQTALTIGYGDLVPTNTAAKVLVFVFSVLTISQLGNEIALIIAFMSTHATHRRDRWRKRYEGAMHREANEKRPQANLMEEMALISKINMREETMSHVYDLFWSALSLTAFWVVGAALFHVMEGWSYGNAVYAVMVMSLTIGFGDFAPVTAAGRVVFIVYALMAVPIVTSFVVQTISGLLSTFSARRARRDQYRRMRVDAPDAFKPHSMYISSAHDNYQVTRDRLMNPTAEDLQIETTGETGTDATEEEAKQERDERRISHRYDAAEAMAERDMSDESNGDPSPSSRTLERRELELGLIRQLMDLTVRLEAEARELLLECMEHGIARTLLLADRNVQIRDVKAIRGDDVNILKIWRGINDESESSEMASDGPWSKLAKVRRYRNTFAEILVVGAILQRLDGPEMNTFERWRKRDRSEVAEEQAKYARQVQQDLEKIVDQQFDGITARLFRRKAKSIQEHDSLDSA